MTIQELFVQKDWFKNQMNNEIILFYHIIIFFYLITYLRKKYAI